MASKANAPVLGENGNRQIFQLGEIRSATDVDFEHFIQLADESGNGWVKKLEKNGLIILQKETGVSSIRMVKVIGEIPGVTASTAFDTILDGEYRKSWDDNVIEDYEICRLDDYNDIGYYSMKCPAPLKNRDFVNQRSWKMYGKNQYVVFNHSVSIKDIPIKNKFIRGISYITGFLIRSSETGCKITYVTQSDPKGKIPTWVINMTINKIAPSVFRKLNAACCKYEDWKAKNKPDFKPWLNPDQNEVKVVDVAALNDSILSTDSQEILNEDKEELPEGEDEIRELTDRIAEKYDQK